MNKIKSFMQRYGMQAFFFAFSILTTLDVTARCIWPNMHKEPQMPQEMMDELE